MVEKKKFKIIVLTEKDRKLLQGIHKSLEDIKKGGIKQFAPQLQRKRG